jgi:hypothetical protein
MLFDIIVFVLTIYKATKVGYKVPLMQIVIRDGMCSVGDTIAYAVDDWLHSQDHCTSCKSWYTKFISASRRRWLTDLSGQQRPVLRQPGQHTDAPGAQQF